MSKVFLIAGLGFGDEGKGSITDYLARVHGADVVVRYNGGAQAAHNVIALDGRHHTFSQFGSGTFVPGCKTHLSRFMVVNPIFMQAEEQHLRQINVPDAFDRMTIERDALVTNPFQVSLNRIREMARAAHERTGEGRHGSCGMGIGETMRDFLANPEDALRIGDLEDHIVMRSKLQHSRERKFHEACDLIRDVPISPAIQQEFEILQDATLVGFCAREYNLFSQQIKIVDASYLSDLLTREATAVFEGAQGVLLDENWGFYPYTTWSTTTFKNADELLRGTDCDVTKIGILRAYHTRHGAGPFPTEDAEMSRELVEAHNSSGHVYQQGFRVGPFDGMLLKYALDVVGHVDEIAMTHLDRVPGKNRICTRYENGHARMTRMLTSAPDCSPEHIQLRDQEELGRLIGAMKPVYETADNQDLLHYVEEEAQCPIRICSYGPKASDKRVRG
jgi:adenylosuccinate synthase